MGVSFKHIFVTPLRNLDVREALKQAIRANQDGITKLNKEQLDMGRDARAASLGRYANYRYKNRFEPVDLLLTGDFRAEFYVKVTDQHTEISSFDSKTNKLVKRYGKDIFGVVPFRYPEMAKVIIDDFINNVRRQLHG